MRLSDPRLPKQPLSREQFMLVLEGKTTTEEIMNKRRARHRRRQVAAYQNQYEASLANASTARLLVGLRNARAEVFRDALWRDEDDEELLRSRAVFWAHKKVLATRPHHPTMAERARVRRETALAQRGQGKAKNR